MEETRKTLEYRNLQGNLSEEAADWKYIATKQQEFLKKLYKKLWVFDEEHSLSEEGEQKLSEICQDIDSIIHIKNFLP